MRLGLKFMLAFVLGNTLLAAIYGYLAVRREVRLFQQMAREETESVGRLMENALADAWRRAGQQEIHRLISDAAPVQASRMRIRWVWFDTQPGSPDAPWTARERLTTITIEQHLAVEDVEPDGTPSLHIYWPVALNVGRRGGLEFSHPLTNLELNKREIIERTALLVGGMVILSALLAAVLGRWYIGAPLRRLIAKTRRIAAGDLSDPVYLNSHDEMAELAEHLNTMCSELSQSQARVREQSAARIAALEQLRHADRLKTVGRLAAGIAHQLGTPLNVVSGRAGLIASGKLTPDQVAESTAAIKTETERMATMVRQLLDFARASTPHKAPVDLRRLLAKTLDMLRSIAEKSHVQLGDVAASEPAVAQVDVGQMQQALTNLVINAIQSMPGGGKVDFAVCRRMAHPPDNSDCPPAACCGIEIRDHGTGIAEEHLPQLFEPFFTTKAAGEGTGLGLSIAYGIVQDHGGWIEVTSQVGQGSCFTVMLPEGTVPLSSEGQES
jgi:two-component system, NtrC family, sensor kinase